MKTDIWMPLYIGDYLADTSRLTTEQHGAYLLLLMDYWRNGRLPDDDAVLANITRLSAEAWEKHRGVLQGFFQGQDGEWVHLRVEQEKDKSEDLKKAQIKKSIVGNYVKYGKLDPRVLEDEYFKAWWAQEVIKHSPKVSLRESLKAPPSPSPSPSSINKTTKNIYSSDFEEFWLDYPKHEGKSAAFKEWKKIAPDKELQDKITAGVLEYRKSRKVKEGFIKDCVNWLKGKHWEDDIMNVQPMMTVTETPWQKAGRLKAAEFSPRIAAKDPNDLYIADDMTYFNTIKEIQNDTTP